MIQSKKLFVGTVPKISFTTGEKRCPSIDEIMSVCFAARTTYAMETNIQVYWIAVPSSVQLMSLFHESTHKKFYRVRDR